jgi:hypothetical protein
VQISPSGSLPFGRGNVPYHLANNKPMFSDAIAATNDRVVRWAQQIREAPQMRTPPTWTSSP